MNVIEWLENVRKLDELITAKQAERDQLMDMATKITPDMNGMPHGTDVSDKVGNVAVKLAALAEETNDLIDQYVNYKEMVVSALEKLPPDEYGVLHRYYIRYMTWGEVAKDMHYSRMSVWRFQQSGIERLKSVMESYTIPVV